jgi:hypothetical protein
MNPNKALWEKGDFTRIASSMRTSGEALVGRLVRPASRTSTCTGVDTIMRSGSWPTAVPRLYFKNFLDTPRSRLPCDTRA